jgi:hypothetical protein
MAALLLELLWMRAGGDPDGDAGVTQVMSPQIGPADPRRSKVGPSDTKTDLELMAVVRELFQIGAIRL